MGGAPVVAPRERTVRFPPDAVSVVADKETMLLSDSTVSPLLPVTEDPNIWMPAGPLTDEPPVIDTVPPVRTDDAPECAMSTPIELAELPAMVKLPAPAFTLAPLMATPVVADWVVPFKTMLPPLDTREEVGSNWTEPPVVDATEESNDLPASNSRLKVPVVEPIVMPVSTCTSPWAIRVRDAAPPDVLVMFWATRILDSAVPSCVAGPVVLMVTLPPPLSAVSMSVGLMYDERLRSSPP